MARDAFGDFKDLMSRLLLLCGSVASTTGVKSVTAPRRGLLPRSALRPRPAPQCRSQELT